MSGRFTILRAQLAIALWVLVCLSNAARAESFAFTIQRVADTNTLVPAGDGNFTSIDEPAIDGNGDMAFAAYDSNGKKGIYAIRNGVIERIVYETDLIPGTSMPFRFLDTTPNIENGVVLFTGRSAGGDSVLVRADGSEYRVVARSGVTQVPGESVGTAFSSLGTTSNELKDGKAVFSASWGSGSNRGSGIFVDDRGTLSSIVKDGDLSSNGAVLTEEIGNPAVDANGDGVAFLGHTDTGGYGVFVVENGVTTLVADETTLIPGTTETFQYTNRPAMDSGWVVFSGGGSSDNGLFLFDGQALRTSAGSPALTSSGVELTNGSEYAVWNGSIYFHAGFNNSDSLVLWRDDELHSILSLGDTLDGAAIWSYSIRHHGVTGNDVGVKVFRGDGVTALYRVQSMPTCGTSSPLGAFDTTGEATRTAIGDYSRLYVADGSAGLRILNVSDPGAPTELGAFTGVADAFDVYYSNSKVYVTDQNAGLRIIDVTSPTAPALLGAINTGGSAFGVKVQGTTAFVAAGFNGIQLIDVSDPANPALLASLPLDAFADDVVVSDNIAYVSCIDEGLQVVDVSHPTALTLISSLDTPGEAIGIAVANDVAYVADGTQGLQVIDVSSPANPVLLTTYPTTDIAASVKVVGDTAYVAAGNAGLWAIDISEPAFPELRALHHTSGLAGGLTIDRTIAYVAELNDGLEIVNFPALTATLTGSFATQGDAVAVCVQGTTAYIAEFGHGFSVVDVSDPSNPVPLGSFETMEQASGIAVANGIAYLTEESDGLQIFDVSDPTAPVHLASYPSPLEAIDIEVSGSIAYLAEGVRLKVLDVSDPANPVQAGSISFGGPAVNVFDAALSGTIVYLAAGPAGLMIFDVSNPGNPTPVGSLGGFQNAVGVAVENGVAYVTDVFAMDLKIVDVSDPSAPNLLGTYDIPGTIFGVQAVGSTVYVANSSRGVRVIDASDPTAPFELTSYDTPGDAIRLAVSGTTVYVADDNAGLQILEVSAPCGGACPGDLNSDGRIDGDDIQPFLNCIVGSGSDCDLAELNGNTILDAGDVDAFVGMLLSGATCP
ncbi:MAG: hypothetical protein H6818_03370 [Phycisphaerales bacterium]|nr:hypothetical protein [Phycisphaerales bacterium]MCB9864303.1 hypothetical protein [Phycisphaerales bacterium]